MKLVTEMPRFEVDSRPHWDLRLYIRWEDKTDPRFDEAVRTHVNEKVFQDGARKADEILDAEVEHVIKAFLAELLALEQLFVGAEGITMAKGQHIPPGAEIWNTDKEVFEEWDGTQWVLGRKKL